jgi:hypothetical protein
MGKEKISIVAQFCHSLTGIRYHRVPRHISTGHDKERVPEVMEEEVMKRGIWEHAADGVEIADNGMCSGVALAHDHNRVYCTPEKFLVSWRNPCQLSEIIRPDHDRERLLDPAKPVFERIGRLLDTGEMKPAHPPDREDASGIQQLRGPP